MPAPSYKKIAEFNQNPPWALQAMRAAADIYYYKDGSPKKFNDPTENEEEFFKFCERYVEHEMKKLNLAPLEDEKAIELPKPVLLPKRHETALKQPLNDTKTEVEAVGVSRTKPPEIRKSNYPLNYRPAGYQPDSIDRDLMEWRTKQGKADVK
jgi:hypothetical protein